MRAGQTTSLPYRYLVTQVNCRTHGSVYCSGAITRTVDFPELALVKVSQTAGHSSSRPSGCLTNCIIRDVHVHVRACVVHPAFCFRCSGRKFCAIIPVLNGHVLSILLGSTDAPDMRCQHHPGLAAGAFYILDLCIRFYDTLMLVAHLEIFWNHIS
jgi:hypothetical protein